MHLLLSKIVAGGLSAAVFLIWWPQQFPGDDLQHLALRGLLWTLAFEVLCLTFAPLEREATRRIRARMDRRRETVTVRLAAVPAPARTGGAVVLATFGIAAPLALLAAVPHDITREADAQPRVVKQVIVKRPVIEKRIVVRRVVGPAAADAAAGSPLYSSGAAPSVVPAAAPTAKRTRPATPTRTTETTPKQAAPAPATTPAPAPEPDTAAQPAPEPAPAAPPAP
jgi:hypothetical protein